MKRKSLEKADCPIARSLDAIGDWWSLLIIRDAFLGIRRFSEFQKNIGLAKNILTVRLRALVDHGILTTAPASDGSAYQEYVLTPKGRGLFPILVALRQWSEEFSGETKGFPDPAGRPRQRPAGSKTRTARRGRPGARPGRYRGEGQSQGQPPPAGIGLNCFSRHARSNLGQLPLAAQPDPLLGFQLRHLEQRHEDAKLVAPRQQGQIGDGFRDEARGLIRPALPGRIIDWRRADPARGRARPPASCLGQKDPPNPV